MTLNLKLSSKYRTNYKFVRSAKHLFSILFKFPYLFFFLRLKRISEERSEFFKKILRLKIAREFHLVHTGLTAFILNAGNYVTQKEVSFFLNCSLSRS